VRGLFVGVEEREGREEIFVERGKGRECGGRRFM